MHIFNVSYSRKLYWVHIYSVYKKCTVYLQVLRSGSGKKYGSKKDQLSPVGTAKPVSPPSPDLSGLSHDELTILRDVLKRQEEFDNEEVNRKE